MIHATSKEIAEALLKAIRQERERCAVIADECAGIIADGDGEIYIAKKIAALIRQDSKIPVRS